MSLHMMGKVIDSNPPIESKFVLLILADSSDPEGKGYVSMENVARECSLGLDKTEEVVENLVLDGIISPYEFSFEVQGFSLRINERHGVFNHQSGGDL